METFNPFMRDMMIEKWLTYKAIQVGKEIGECCEHWIDQDHLEKLENFEARDEYMENCFAPSLIISAADGKCEVRIKCRSQTMKRFHHSRVTAPDIYCDKCFPNLEKRLQEEFNKYLRKK